MNLVKNIPNLLTLFNLFLGCMGVVYLFNDHMVIMSGERDMFIDMGEIHLACYCVLLAGVIDFFDGFIARLLKVQSELGKQLDSLADMVTFGLLPGLIMYELLGRSYYSNYNAFDYPILFYAIGFALTIFAAVRLGKFNIDPRQANEFRGLPSPSMAFFVISLPLIILRDEMGLTTMLTKNWVLLIIVAGLSYLMVSDIRMLSLKIKSLKFEENQWLFGLILLSLIISFIGILILHVYFVIIPVIILLYIIISIAKNISENGI
ncbi:MAG: CDP-alcohol phosphatidyltransferase family protein [Bacteroidetes bacterium]|nr:CDP-alcohol phosphatidyltransferase family protein [Bacteroidota bacterium]MBK8342287.1 CDP-alcohol phosphatidyltransferase family protein [Bacteroidota bacterium]